jgi:hypothetical protein
MPRFRKKPLVIEAVRLTRSVTVDTLEGTVTGEPGDWLITGIAGEQYPIRHDIFIDTYDPADETATQYLETHGD